MAFIEPTPCGLISSSLFSVPLPRAFIGRLSADLRSVGKTWGSSPIFFHLSLSRHWTPCELFRASSDFSPLSPEKLWITAKKREYYGKKWPNCSSTELRRTYTSKQCGHFSIELPHFNMKFWIAVFPVVCFMKIFYKNNPGVTGHSNGRTPSNCSRRTMSSHPWCCAYARLYMVPPVQQAARDPQASPAVAHYRPDETKRLKEAVRQEVFFACYFVNTALYFRMMFCFKILNNLNVT